MKTAANCMINMFRRPITYIFLLMGIITIILFLRSYNHELSGDELLYEYVWETNETHKMDHDDHQFNRKIESLDDIIQSQKVHYHIVNGRFIVHAIEQAFTGHQGFTLFCVLNAVAFIVFVYLVIILTIGRVFAKRAYLAWVLAVFSLLTLFPFQESLFTSVNYGINYLWSGILALMAMWFWYRIEHGGLPKRMLIPMIITMLIFGCTHEGYVVGVAGGMFFYYCFNFKKYRCQQILLTIPFWVSSAVMLLAPGNLNRALNSGDGLNSLSSTLITGLLTYGDLIVFWILVIGIILALIFQREKLKKFIEVNQIYFYALVVTSLFTFLLHTQAYSHTFTELLSLILILKYLDASGAFSVNDLKSVILSVSVTVILIIHQSMILKDTLLIHSFQHSIVEEYKKSSDGLLLYDEPDISCLTRPYIRIWKYTDLNDWNIRSLRIAYGNKTKPPVFLSHDDYIAYTIPKQFFVESNRVGTAPVYATEHSDYYWINMDSIQSGDQIETEYFPVRFSDGDNFITKLLFAVTPSHYPDTGKETMDTIHGRYGDAIRIIRPSNRRIKSFRRVTMY